MTMRKMGQCLVCVHSVNGGDRLECPAFPDGIPDEIYMGEFDHRKPAPGDNGIMFEVDPEADPKLVSYLMEQFEPAAEEATETTEEPGEYDQGPEVEEPGEKVEEPD